ncbi:hypothetical protein D9M70_609430 [compost metagenome]
MFTVESRLPIPAPKQKSVTARGRSDEKTVSKGRERQTSMVDAMITLRQPLRAVIAPAMGMASKEPAPRQSSRIPSVPSDRAARSLAYGTKGAQTARP